MYYVHFHCTHVHMCIMFTVHAKIFEWLQDLANQSKIRGKPRKLFDFGRNFFKHTIHKLKNTVEYSTCVQYAMTILLMKINHDHLHPHFSDTYIKYMYMYT